MHRALNPRPEQEPDLVRGPHAHLGRGQSDHAGNRGAKDRNNLFRFGRAANAAEKAMGLDRVPFSFETLDAGLDAWGRMYGTAVQGASSIDDFIYGLQHLPNGMTYNLDDAGNWQTGVRASYQTAVSFAGNCLSIGRR
jgi:hypothetical protein